MTFSQTLAEAAAILLDGGVVAFPTETFYGLAVDAFNPLALKRLFNVKGRPDEKASALLVRDIPMFVELCSEFSPTARRLAETYWPGPLTIAAPARSDVPESLVSDGCVAARVSAHPIARALVALVGRPITATSANPSGMPPVTQAESARAYFPEDAVYILDGGDSPGGAPSTLVRVRGSSLEILRQGSIQLQGTGKIL